MGVVAPDGRIVLANRQAEALFGYGRLEMAGQAVEGLIPERFRPRHVSERETYAANARPRPMGAGLDLCALRADGSEFPCEISLSPIDTEDGRLVIAAIRDVTDRRKLLAAELAARLAAEEATRARDQVLAIVSHDLMNLLTAINYTSTLLLRAKPATDNERRMYRCGEVIAGSLGSMERLLRDVLDAERAEHALPQVELAAEDLAGLIRETVELMTPLAAQKGVSLGWLEGEPAFALCERSRVQQVLHNLIGNAIHFTPQGQQVLVRQFREGDAMHVAVSDQGPGIPPEQRAHVFDRYWRGRGVSRHGLGLGLFIVKRLIDAHGGRIWIEATPGAGATFVFTLQAVDQH